MSTKIPIKIEWEGDKNNTAKQSWYTYSSLRVVEVIVLTRILDHFKLMWQIAISDGWMNWQKYPKNGKWIRIQQPKTLESNICLTYPGMGCGTLACILGVASSIFENNCRTDPHTMSESHIFIAYLHSSLFTLLSWIWSAHFSFEMVWTLLAHCSFKMDWT